MTAIIGEPRRKRPGGGSFNPIWYGEGHRRLRRTLRAEVEAGGVRCARCGRPIVAGEPWDLGHAEGGGPSAYSGPEHRACNRRTRQLVKRVSRRW